MAFSIPPISSPGFKPVAPSEIGPARSTTGETRAGGTGDTGFTKAVGDALSNLDQLENAVDRAGRQAATGDLESVSDYMIATTEAQLATEITVAIRDRAITAFNDIMRMQI